jgi:hypothetical protein
VRFVGDNTINPMRKVAPLMTWINIFKMTLPLLQDVGKNHFKVLYLSSSSSSSSSETPYGGKKHFIATKKDANKTMDGAQIEWSNLLTQAMERVVDNKEAYRYGSRSPT